MEIVVDTSVIIAVILNEDIKNRLVDTTRGANLIVPLSVHWEVGNALSAMLKRKRITQEQALHAVEVYERIPLRFVQVELDESIKIAGDQGIYAYDAYRIRCAQKYSLRLLSLDKNLLVAATKMGVRVIEVDE